MVLISDAYGFSTQLQAGSVGNAVAAASNLQPAPHPRLLSVGY